MAKTEIILMVLAGVVLSATDDLSCGRLLDTLKLNDVDVNPSRTDKVTFSDTSIKICSQGRCATISNEKLLSSFPNTFKTVGDYTRQTGLPYHAKIKKIPNYCSRSQSSTWMTTYCNQLPPSDGDSCCSTHKYVTNYTGEMQNTGDETCVIICLPKLFQMVTEGICGPSGSCNTDTAKSCIQQYTMQSLLVWNTETHKLRFEMFHIPTYCSCIR